MTVPSALQFLEYYIKSLHISRDAPTSTPSPPRSKERRVLQYIVRFIVFLVAPLIYVWQMENSFVQKHLLILTYSQVLYIVVFQGVLIQSFLDQRSKIIKMMLVTVILYTLTCVVCQLLPEETAVNAATQSEDCGKCGDCEYYTKEDIPSEYAGNFFPPGKSKVLGIGTSLNGTRLSKAILHHQTEKLPSTQDLWQQLEAPTELFVSKCTSSTIGAV